jgi:hypothetical protein
VMGAKRRDDELPTAKKIRRHRRTTPGLIATGHFETMPRRDGRGFRGRDAFGCRAI